MKAAIACALFLLIAVVEAGTPWIYSLDEEVAPHTIRFASLPPTR